MKDKPNPNKQPKIKKQGASQLKWSLKLLLLSFALSLCFAILSEVFLSGTGVIIAVIVIVVFILISILFDMIAMATTAASLEPFRAMASKKVRVAKEAVRLINNADKVSSISADVIGDICGILSGSAGASIVIKIAIESNSALSIIVASLVSAFVASITIFGKSVCKKYAIDNCDKILLKVGKVMSWFTPQPKSKSKKETKQSSDMVIDKNEKTGEYPVFFVILGLCI